MGAADRSPVRPRARFGREHAFIVLGILVIVAAVLIAVYRDSLAPRPYSLVTGSPPQGATYIPEAPLSVDLTGRISSPWVYGPDAWVPETAYRLLSRRFWLAGTVVYNTFFIPEAWPGRLNLSANNLSLDPSGEYLVVPSESWMLTNGTSLWVYTILHGLTQNPFDDDCNCSWNHSAPYAFGMLVREQQYGITWTSQYQAQHEMILGYDPSLPDAYSSPLFPSSTDLTPIVVDGQEVYATGGGGVGEAPIPPTAGYQPSQYPVDPSGSGGVIVDLTNSTLFLFEIPLSALPHTGHDVMFDAMFLLEIWPPVGVEATSLALDYQPGSSFIRSVPGGPDGWNNTAAYLPFFTPWNG